MAKYDKTIQQEQNTVLLLLNLFTYYQGNPLEYDANNDRYTILSTGDIAGIFLGEKRTVANDDYDSIIIGGEVYEGGLLDSQCRQFVVTEDIIAAWAVRGFYIKRT